MNDKAQFHIRYWLVAVLVFAGLQYLLALNPPAAEIPYSEFERYLRDGKLEQVAVSERFVEGTLKEPLPSGTQRFIAVRVEPDLSEHLQGFDVRYGGKIESTLVRDLLSWLLPAALFIGVWLVLLRRLGGGLGGGMMQIGKSRARIYVETDMKVTFADVAGVDEAKDELREIVDFLRNPQAYGRLGGRMPKGVLLVGPPGTGKTLLARAVAGEARVPFFSISGSEFVEMFVGVGAARVRDLFEQARAKRRRSSSSTSWTRSVAPRRRAAGRWARREGADAQPAAGRARRLRHLHRAGAAGRDQPPGNPRPGAAAGRPFRPPGAGRPAGQGRPRADPRCASQARAAGGGRRCAGDRRADAGLHRRGPGQPGQRGHAAGDPARRRRGDHGRLQCGDRAHRRRPGKRNRLLNPREREIVAYHEMGHALVAMALPGVDAVHKVSIIPRGMGALGYTIQRPTEDRFLMTREELENKMAVLLGGRAAEWLIFGHLSTGAADDLAKVTDIARAMVTRYGMSEALGHVALERERPRLLDGEAMYGLARAHDYGETTAAAVDSEVQAIVERAFQRALRLLAERQVQLERAARCLLERETLDGEVLRQLIEPQPAPSGTAVG